MHPATSHALKTLQSLGCREFEIYLERKESTAIEARDQKVDSLTRAADIGLSIRVLDGRRMGFSYTTSLEKSAIERAARSAKEIAAHLPEDPFHRLGTFDSVAPALSGLTDFEGLRLPLEQKVARAIELERDVRARDRRITGVRKASVAQAHYAIEIVDHQGASRQAESTVFTSSVLCKAEQDGESQMGGDFGFSHQYGELDTAQVAKHSVETATELLGAKPAPTRVMAAVLRNSVVADLLDFLSASFSAENIDKGRSLLIGKEGQRVFSSHLQLIDDGRLAGGLGSFPFDGEGVPCGTQTLIDRGTVSGILIDRYYAAKLGRAPTGNATRGIKSPPSLSTTNLYLKPGARDERQLIDAVRNGILITDLMGLHTANSVTGDFSLGASGILIENGHLSQPVRGFAVAGNILSLLNQVVEVGSDLRFFGGTGAPSLWISEISVGGS